MCGAADLTPADDHVADRWISGRRVERELITEYRAAVEAVLPNLSPGTLEQCVEIANAPDEVRGYEYIKLASVARFRARLADVKGAS
jgi:indolepyruvate ferredoxin oxidoreductase